MPPLIVLGIESSCDDTAAAVVEDGRRILSSVVSSQSEIHHPFGGVVPELASRRHIEAISLVVEQALGEAGLDFGMIDVVAATRGPGLVGSLLVGFSYAKAVSYAIKRPLVGVNHLLAHIHSIFLTERSPDFPFTALLVSGGHTALYHVKSFLDLDLLGQTRDDAAGEAFDKVSKMLGLGYPGGVVIERLAEKGDPARISFPRALMGSENPDFSFSGVKTAVLRHIEKKRPLGSRAVADVAASFQEAVCEALAVKTVTAAQMAGSSRIVIAGGVAANKRLRGMMDDICREQGIELFVPPPVLCGDNAAMVAAAGYHLFLQGRRCSLDDDVFSRADRKGVV